VDFEYKQRNREVVELNHLPVRQHILKVLPGQHKHRVQGNRDWLHSKLMNLLDKFMVFCAVVSPARKKDLAADLLATVMIET
jgi:hypothetical protein